MIKRRSRRVLFGAIACILFAASTCAARWVLPVADGSEEPPSSPSIQGVVASVKLGQIALEPETRQGKLRPMTVVAVTSDTQMFEGDGGHISSTELSVGQYVWVWYMHKHEHRSGTPPRAAVVHVWSAEPGHQPSDDIRWSHARRR
jgi:hypothetical protein